MTHSDSDTVRHIVLADVPTGLFIRHQDHMDELIRELQIVAIGVESGSARDVPARIVKVLQEVLAVYEPIRGANRAEAVRAIEEGREVVTLEMEVPAGAAEDIVRAMETLDAADRLCREGDLLTLESTPEVRELRRHLAGETLRQLAE